MSGSNGSKERLITACKTGDLGAAVTEMMNLQLSGKNPLNEAERRQLAQEIVELTEKSKVFPDGEEKFANYFGIIKLIDPGYLEIISKAKYALEHTAEIIRAFEPDAHSDALREYIEDYKRRSSGVAREFERGFKEGRESLKNILTDEVKKELLNLAGKEIKGAGSLGALQEIVNRYQPLLALHRDSFHIGATDSVKALEAFKEERSQQLAREVSPAASAHLFLPAAMSGSITGKPVPIPKSPAGDDDSSVSFGGAGWSR